MTVSSGSSPFLAGGAGGDDEEEEEEHEGDGVSRRIAVSNTGLEIIL